MTGIAFVSELGVENDLLKGYFIFRTIYLKHPKAPYITAQKYLIDLYWREKFITRLRKLATKWNYQTKSE